MRKVEILKINQEKVRIVYIKEGQKIVEVKRSTKKVKEKEGEGGQDLDYIVNKQKGKSKIQDWKENNQQKQQVKYQRGEGDEDKEEVTGEGIPQTHHYVDSSKNRKEKGREKEGDKEREKVRNCIKLDKKEIYQIQKHKVYYKEDKGSKKLIDSFTQRIRVTNKGRRSA